MESEHLIKMWNHVCNTHLDCDACPLNDFCETPPNKGIIDVIEKYERSRQNG